MDSVATAIHDGKLKFEEAAEEYSSDKDSKMNGGLVMNPSSGSSSWQVDQLDPSLLFEFDKMSVGQVSNAVYTTTRETDDAFRIVYLKKRTDPHRLNMQDDYQKLQELTMEDKQQKALETWRNKKKFLTYIRIAEEYRSCEIIQDWMTQ
jgi:peptidyl-prolyl cis-trans isomerase SurA